MYQLSFKAQFTQKSQPKTRMQSQMLAFRLLSLQAQPVI